MNNVIILVEKKHEARVCSSVLAEHLGRTHKAVLQLIDKNTEAFKELGQLPFKMGVVSKNGAGQATRYALLNEDQAYFLLALSRNSKRVIELKLNLVQSFGRFKREQQTVTDYLPFYHDLHDVIKALTEYAQANGSSVEARIFHLTYNKLINKSCGIDAHHRQHLAVNARVNITTATAAVITAIRQGIESADDYHAIYQRAKVAVASVVYTGNALGDRIDNAATPVEFKTKVAK